MALQEAINHQRQLLALHRATLAGLLQQQALLGAAYAPPATFNSIRIARDEIRRIKAWLRQERQPVEDHPDDDDFTDATVQQSRAARLRDLCHNHVDFIADRLSSFVGRAAELVEIRRRITAALPTGGYITITGQAGQGKSSIIAKLIHDAGPDTMAHHFIPFTSRPDHQVGLLRDIMAQLILKHNLPEHFVAAESRPALRDYFATLVRTLNEQDHAEVIYIDGLDQLQEDLSGLRDLSFLPANPPPGIVFVLGTRPNDTLKPLELLRPYDEYQLPNLSRADFDLVLQHRGVDLSADLADRFYITMQENALYLDLVAREIHTAGVDRVEAIIARVASNPNNLFSLAIDRLKLQRQSWRELIKPMLGVLLTAQSALTLRAIRTLIHQDEDAVREGLQRLGGLVARDGAGRYTLYHLKLRDYLRYDPQQPTKEYIFAPDEEETYHQKFITWCESGKGGLAVIWRELPADATENERRVYAREHYITHLAAASNWEQLWEVVDTGTYGHAKLRYDPSTRAYVQDLDRARQAVLNAAAVLDEPVSVTLPRLWRYSLLRGSLASRADGYPDILFTVLADIGRDQEAISLAEMLSNPKRKATILCRIGVVLKQRGATSGDIVIARAVAVAQVIDSPWLRTSVLSAVAQVQAEARLWDAAIATTRMITEASTRAQALCAVAQAQVAAGQLPAAVALCDEAAATARTVEYASLRAQALSAVARAQVTAGQLPVAVALSDEAAATARTITQMDVQVWAFRAVVWSQARAGLWDVAIATARMIKDASTRTQALSIVAQAKLAIGQLSAAASLYDEAAATARTIEETFTRARMIMEVAEAQAKAGLWDAAIATTHTIELEDSRASALSAVAQSQAKAGLWDTAIATAHTIKHPVMWERSIQAVAEAQAKAGLWDAAIATIDTIEREDGRGHLLSVVARSQAKAGLRDAAIATARMIKKASTRAQALSAVAQAQVAAGQLATAVALCDEAAAAARTIEQVDARGRALSEVAQVQAEAGMWDAAVATARMIKDASTRAQALSAVAQAQVAAGQLATAVALCDEAAAAARTLKQESTRMQVYILCEVAQTKVAAGQLAAAVALCDEAAATARMIQHASLRAMAISDVAEAQAKIGLWDAAIATAHTIEQAPTQAGALSIVAQAQAEARQYDKAAVTALAIAQVDAQDWAFSTMAQVQAKAGLWDAAITAAHTIEQVDQQAGALSMVAQAQVAAGQVAAGVVLCDEVAAIARMIEQASLRAKVLSDVAEVQIAAGQLAAAVALCDEAAATARTIAQVDDRGHALSAVAEAQAKAGLWDAAIATARTIERDYTRAHVLSVVAQALSQAGLYDDAIATARAIEQADTRAQALSTVAGYLARLGHLVQVRELIQNFWCEAATYQEVWLLLSLSNSFIITDSALLPALLAGADWVAEFLETSA